jgi:hypothetical protein
MLPIDCPVEKLISPEFEREEPVFNPTEPVSPVPVVESPVINVI